MNIEISTLQEICDGLLIPDEELLNIRILNAAKRGIEWARKHPDTDVQIAQRVRLCRSIMRLVSANIFSRLYSPVSLSRSLI